MGTEHKMSKYTKYMALFIDYDLDSLCECIGTLNWIYSVSGLKENVVKPKEYSLGEKWTTGMKFNVLIAMNGHKFRNMISSMQFG